LNPFIFLIFTFLVWTIVPLGLSAAVILGIYFYLDIKIFNRSKDMEDRLADYFTYVSTSLKGGMSFEASLWSAIRPDFGLLAKEMGLVSKKVMTGYDVSQALLELHDKYNSPELKRTLSLMLSELEVGGKMSKIIDDIVVQLKETRKLKAKMVASVVSYIIFIGAITIFIAPSLFGPIVFLFAIIIPPFV
jgi:Flp pilus assembly protein TadB